MYHQADPERVASSAGLLRTSGYLGAILASSATAVFFAERADTPGMHHLTWFMLTVAVLFLAVTLADRSLRHVSGSAADPDAGSEPRVGDTARERAVEAER